MLVSTLDGIVTALDVENFGITLWAMYTSTSPLLQSTLHNMEVRSGDIAFRLLPSLDGNFYMYNEAITQGIPVSTDNLLSHSIRLGPDLIVGGKEIISYGIDYITGQVHDAFLCSQYMNFNNAQWNVTVGENQVLLSSGEEAQCGKDECYGDDDGLPSCHIGVKLVPPDGVVYFYDKRVPSQILWQRKVTSRCFVSSYDFQYVLDRSFIHKMRENTKT
ncbi:unnamed protein product [Soboliphyme baturini]|uniref:Bulb-type lectin domain-containing protein n=1 Tax=Soboliphyme baturini TaxID=241478 RepID=A0A183IHI2_9BILA|nr:unnamed protein product [Soboliphyme baturini]